MMARTNQEINDIVNANIDYLNENPRLFSFAKNARRRIARVQREKKKSWALYEMN